jgi:hypothetical protein
MSIHPIPQKEWRRALDDFSLSHYAWPVSVEVVSSLVGAQPEVLELPLNGISVSDSSTRPTIAVSMSGDHPEHVTHLVDDVSGVFIQRDGNVDRAIEIVAADGTRTILRFAPPSNRIVSRSVH